MPWMTSLFFIHVILEVVWCELEVLEILLHPRLLNLVHFVYRRRNIEKPRFFKLFSITVVFKKAFCVWDLCWYLFEYIMHNGWVLHDAFIYWSTAQCILWTAQVFIIWLHNVYYVLHNAYQVPRLSGFHTNYINEDFIMMMTKLKK